MKIQSKYKLEQATTEFADRLPLKAIFIKDNQAIATDGSIMAVVPCEHSEGENGKQILSDDFKTIRKAQKKLARRSDNLSLELGSEIKANGDNGESYSFRMPETQFPQSWKQVIPDSSKVKFKISFDVQLFQRLAEAIGATEKDNTVVTLEMVDDVTAIRVTHIKDNEAFGVLMPVRRP